MKIKLALSYKWWRHIIGKVAVKKPSIQNWLITQNNLNHVNSAYKS